MKAKSKSVGGLSLLPCFRVMRGKEIAFGPGKMALLELVAKTGSIGKAAKRMEMSYMRAWSLIQTMNACFKEPVIEAVRGGHERGGAELTATGQQVLTLYGQMEADGRKAVQADCLSLQNCSSPNEVSMNRPRHNRRLDGLFYDGHVQTMKPADLSVRNFREAGSLPVIASYPGE